MAILRTDPNIPIMQTTDGKMISPTTNDPIPIVRIFTDVPNTPVIFTQPGKATFTCTGTNPTSCTPG